MLNSTKLTIEDCYTDFAVECNPEDSHTAVGFISFLSMSANTNNILNVERCYAACEASEQMDYGKAFIYQVTNTVSTINFKDCYYRTAPHFTDDYALGKTDEEMKQQATFENWDFENVWDIDEGETMPYLKNELPEPCGLFVLLLLFSLRNTKTLI